MKRGNADPLCCFCGRPTPRYDPAATFTLDLKELGAGPRVVLCWHLAAGCAVADPLCEAFANADRLKGEEGDRRMGEVYVELVRRIGETHGPDGLRGAVDVRRDVDDVRVTLRGPGLLWGRRSERRRRR